MLFAMQTLDINRQQNYMVELTLKILSSSQSAGCELTIFLPPAPSPQPAPNQTIRLSSIVTLAGRPPCWLCMEEVERLNN